MSKPSPRLSLMAACLLALAACGNNPQKSVPPDQPVSFRADRFNGFLPEMRSYTITGKFEDGTALIDFHAHGDHDNREWSGSLDGEQSKRCLDMVRNAKLNPNMNISNGTTSVALEVTDASGHTSKGDASNGEQWNSFALELLPRAKVIRAP